MRFGLAILPEHPWSAAEAMWREADAMGFDHAWTFDHITWAGLPESPWFGAVPTLAAAAAVTSRIRLGTFVSSPNNHHPVQFLREVLALDDISAGRFILGIGTGGDLDAQITGEELTLRDRVARFHEFAHLLDRLLTEERVSSEGRFYAARDVVTRPGPVRAPEGPGAAPPNRVPLVIAANGPKSIRLAVEKGEGWMTYGGKAETDEQWWGLVTTLSHAVDQALDAAGRERHTLARYLNIDAGPTFALHSVAAFEEAVGRAAELGFTDLITHWPRVEEPFRGQREVLDAVVADVLPRWR
ncbi:LLM class flavin-dependent oxidoreductase [Intrasporangium sp.]|uniref:LLM class flavin-dependent oxidoreductase n=1 Tax=Intrasporangium sp. TaxID=1925024 RepID=UPI0029395A6A|nr:LLM class flavin-dependent oxidoreductase [Intrasporangium sp.]MDV3222503.1 LLM class flavin-dependent oxidoreductase [Intrasporangium sp.]